MYDSSLARPPSLPLWLDVSDFLPEFFPSSKIRVKSFLIMNMSKMMIWTTNILMIIRMNDEGGVRWWVGLRQPPSRWVDESLWRDRGKDDDNDDHGDREPYPEVREMALRGPAVSRGTNRSIRDQFHSQSSLRHLLLWRRVLLRS